MRSYKRGYKCLQIEDRKLLFALELLFKEIYFQKEQKYIYLTSLGNISFQFITQDKELYTVFRRIFHFSHSGKQTVDIRLIVSLGPRYPEFCKEKEEAISTSSHYLQNVNFFRDWLKGKYIFSWDDTPFHSLIGINEGKVYSVAYLKNLNYNGVGKNNLLKNHLFWLIFYLLLFKGYFHLHSACVKRIEDVYLCVGPCGSGKTTLSQVLVKEGFNLVADDSLFFYNINGSNKINCFGFDVFEEKVNATTLTPNVIIFPQIHLNRYSQFYPVSIIDALCYMLKKMHPKPIPPIFTSLYLDTLKSLFCQCKLYSLIMGKDVKNSPRGLTGIIKQII